MNRDYIKDWETHTPGQKMNMEVYWRIYMDDQKGLTPVCLQWFDENDYNKDKWLFEDKYPTEEAALKIINRIHIYAGRFLVCT